MVTDLSIQARGEDVVSMNYFDASIVAGSSTNGDIFLAPPHSQLLQQQHLSHSTLPEIRRSRRGRGRSKGSKGTHTAGELNYAHSLPDPIVDVSKIVYNPRYAMYKNGTGDLYY